MASRPGEQEIGPCGDEPPAFQNHVRSYLRSCRHHDHDQPLTVTDGETFSIQRGASKIEPNSILGSERARLAKFLVEQCRATKEGAETFEFMTHENDLRVGVLDYRDADAEDAQEFLVSILGSSGKLRFPEESYLGGRFWLTKAQVDALCSLLLA